MLNNLLQLSKLIVCDILEVTVKKYILLFFQDSPTYRNMYDNMVNKKWLVKDNNDGVARYVTCL